MQLTHDNPPNEDSKTTWSLLVEIPISKSTLDADMPVDPSTRQFSDCLRDFDIPPETTCFCNTTIEDIVRKAIDDNRADNQNIYLMFRLFFQRKSLGMKHGNGAWGFYVIEKAGEDSDSFGQISCRIIEIYFYREGKGR